MTRLQWGGVYASQIKAVGRDTHDYFVRLYTDLYRFYSSWFSNMNTLSKNTVSYFHRNILWIFTEISQNPTEIKKTEIKKNENFRTEIFRN